jgi:hypothetical protein
MNKTIAIVFFVALLGASTVAHAQSSPVRMDLEIDPTAYALAGYSVHLGAGSGRLRVDLGMYSLDVPRFAHGNRDFDVSFDGAGARLQWFRSAEQIGAFADVSAGITRKHIRLTGSDAFNRTNVFGTGIDVGWRFALPAGFYVTPWAGVEYDFGVHDVVLDGRAFRDRSISPFAAVHVGYRLR